LRRRLVRIAENYARRKGASEIGTRAPELPAFDYWKKWGTVKRK